MRVTRLLTVVLLAACASAGAADPKPNLYQLNNQYKVSGVCADTAQKCVKACPSNTRDPFVEIQCKSGCETARAQCALDAANRHLGQIKDEYVCLSPATRTWQIYPAPNIAAAQKAAGGDHTLECRAVAIHQTASVLAAEQNDKLQRSQPQR